MNLVQRRIFLFVIAVNVVIWTSVAWRMLT
jgi:hypothetical protein